MKRRQIRDDIMYRNMMLPSDGSLNKTLTILNAESSLCVCVHHLLRTAKIQSTRHRPSWSTGYTSREQTVGY